MLPVTLFYEVDNLPKINYIFLVGKVLFTLVVFSCAANSKIFDARVASVETEYTNIDTNLSITELNDAGLRLGDRIQFEHQGQVILATFGDDYADVERGDWIATENDDGTLELAISFGGACEKINCKIGDALLVQLVPNK